MRIFIDTGRLRDVARSLRADSYEAGDIAHEVLRIGQQIPVVGSGTALRARVDVTRHHVGELSRALYADAAELDRQATQWEALEDAPTRLDHLGIWTSGLAGVSDFVDRLDAWLGPTHRVFDGVLSGLTTRVRGHVREGRYVSDYLRYRRGTAPVLRHLGSAREATRAVRRVGTLSRVVGVLDVALDIVSGYTHQRAADDGVSGITDSHRANRAVAAAVIEGGSRAVGSLAGRGAGAVVGAAVGAIGGPPGAIIGGVVGSVVGGWIGEYVGEKVGGSVKHKVFGHFRSLFGG